MLDGVLLERAGVPTAVLCTEPFARSGAAMAEAQGLPLYPFLLTPHPLSNALPEELERWAESLAPQVARILLGTQ